MGTRIKVTTYIEREGQDIELLITGSFYCGDPGRYSGPPERCYPAEPDEWDIEDIKAPEGVTLTDEEYEEVYNKTFDLAIDEMNYLAEAAADARAERERDYDW